MKLKSLLIPFTFIVCIFMTACNDDSRTVDEPEDIVVEEPELPEVPPEKEITSIDDIEYQALCPLDKYKAASLFYIDNDGAITYSDDRKMPSYEHAHIYLENVIPSDAPNWSTLQSIPYQATYSYVFSPLNDKVRLVRNESSGPMFKNIVPENEFDYIVKELKENDELHYTLVLANVYKLGIQKLSFCIRKK